MAKQPYRYPFPPFPVGWFAVAYSDELPLGGVKPVDAFGRQLVLFRGEDGVARVFDALCPHLGAHLGHDGAVAGNGIVCPFHHWAFDGAGRCVDIPYSTRPIPRQARVRSWPVREVNQAIFVWYDPQQRPPFWELPVVPQAGAADWTRPHSIDRVARFHCQEIRENGVDPAHFGTVHGFPVQTFEVEARGHVLRQTSRLTAQLGPEASDTARLTVDYHGLGYAVAHQTIGEMEFLVLSHVTPIDEDTTLLRFTVSLRRIPSLRSLAALFSHLREAGGKQGLWGMARRFTEGARAREIPGYLARAAAGTSRGIAATRGRSLLGEIMTQLIAIPSTVDFGRQLDQDIYITENKAYLEQPLYRDGEHTIHAMRQWARQFYPDAEPAQVTMGPQAAPDPGPAEPAQVT
ncbi:MAG: Rieske 2Fe-2S domain-containing protein [Minicystis sp.]